MGASLSCFIASTINEIHTDLAVDL